ncbi:hypothetical protein NPIL_656631, partial [Nephila pilipes]
MVAFGALAWPPDVQREVVVGMRTTWCGGGCRVNRSGRMR